MDHLGNSWKVPREKIGQKLKDKCKVEFGHSFKIEGKTEKVCRVKQLETKQITHNPTERKGPNY